jgi:NADH-quinone oxidoreductase subunit M
MVLAAMYLLIMVGKIVFGELRVPDHAESDLPPDLNAREIGVLVPLAALCIWMGVQPTVLTDAMRGSVEQVLSPYPRLVQEDNPTPNVTIVKVEEVPHG